MDERRYVELADDRGGIDRIAWYDSGGDGPPVLLIHGFAEYACTWDALIDYLPENFRYIRIDAKGFGYSSKNDPEHLTLFDQAACVAAFIRRLDLHGLTLVGHSMGGAVSCLLLNYTDISERISKLVLVDPAGMFTEVPEFIASLALVSPQNPLLRFASEDLMVYLVMSQAYFREEKIGQELVRQYAEVMRLPGARECVIAAARDFRIPNVPGFQADLKKQKLPALIIWGAEDRIIPLDDADKFHDCLVNSRLVVFPECGHSPQEELPEETAAVIAEFLTGSSVPTLPVPAEEVPPPPQPQPAPLGSQLRQLTDSYKLRMTRLVDRWSFGTVFLLIFIKILQLLKKFGMRAEENGWRKATGIFLRNEYSKFVLSCFRLRYYRDGAVPDNFPVARQQLIRNLADYIRSHSQLHWSAAPAMFRLGRRKIDFTDIAEAFYDKTGELLWIEMHFDTSRENFQLLTADHIRDALRRMVINVNKLRVSECGDQGRVLAGRLRRWARRVPGYSYGARHELRSLVERLLTATFIHCELLPKDPETLLARRLASPNLRKYRNPGWGLLNVIARFTPDFREADLWMQYHHVPVDGMPMQEILADLKTSWGCAGVLAYPALSSPAARPEILYAGNRLFRNRFFIDFEPMLKLRRELNAKYATLMEGPATVAGMLIWGLAQHRFFHNCKMLFPVDSEPKSGNPAERELSLVFIRAGQYIDRANPLSGFLNFQKEFNRRLWHTRKGSSESYELLELYSMIHPLFYQIGLRLMPESMGEFVGSMGLSILRNADIFISPLSDLQVNGFMTIGDLTHPTEDGGTAGAVASCGTRDQIRFYQEAMTDLAKNYRRFLEPQQ
ncbi:MAG: alpha/beta hydrolase [Lentisphaeria bacterium]|nr:alpha/beta hydrolase [Lentisphaeria bacterium]